LRKRPKLRKRPAGEHPKVRGRYQLASNGRIGAQKELSKVKGRWGKFEYAYSVKGRQLCPKLSHRMGQKKGEGIVEHLKKKEGEAAGFVLGSRTVNST